MPSVHVTKLVANSGNTTYGVEGILTSKAPSQYKDRLFQVWGHVKIRQSWDYLIFSMGIPILVRRHLYIETAPRCSRQWQPVSRTLYLPWPRTHFTNKYLSKMMKINGVWPKCDEFWRWSYVIADLRTVLPWILKIMVRNHNLPHFSKSCIKISTHLYIGHE